MAALFRSALKLQCQLIGNNHDIGPGDHLLRLSSDELEGATASLRCQGDELSAARGRVKFHLQFTQGKASFAVEVVRTKLLRLLDQRAHLALTAIDSAARSS